MSMPRQTVGMILILFVSLSTCVAAEPQRFSSWWPRYRSAINTIKTTNCSAQYDAYLTGDQPVGNLTANDPELAIWHVDSAVTPLTNCLLRATPELYKSMMASAQVVLGLMPTLLASISPSAHETAMLFVFGDRQLLSFLLMVASPASAVDASGNLHQHVQDLKGSREWLSADSSALLLHHNLAIVVLEFFLAAAAAGNVLVLTYEICLRVIFSFAQQLQWMPGLWVAVGVATHLLMTVALRTRVHLRDGRTSNISLPTRVLRWARAQFTASDSSSDATEVQLRDRTVGNVLISWFTGLLAAANTLLGILQFSSMLFISPNDALFIVVRFVASAVVCRVLVKYELWLVRQQVKVSGSDDGEQVKGDVSMG
ncbi:uncharacterized protein BO95DRAFT_38803 [Aspergillus brunneoviolaceus CBS 621.78]|uniref:Uncharacterized protein n=1 Tax=Aspergillus brunneoviolaceus CBS 621.78 TaxID=1450534 RepID=A0ACD1GIG3_9EURO|nr:hypothetical protein BO95DRAFT_38803 [Aspergillus brunneoviolaceus CBS 621.78]RAH48889.1 hypothetical protein BO95DRAFT_38803 [Aspergillus brunneoviolaceus CBS 621.78]